MKIFSFQVTFKSITTFNSTPILITKCFFQHRWILLVATTTLGISAQLSTDTSLLASAANALISTVGTVNSYNGPETISGAPTAPTNNNYIPLEEQMRFFNYYAQSAYCSDQLEKLTCDTCQYFKSYVNTVNGVAVLKNNLLNTLAFITVSDSRQEIVVSYRGTIVDLRNYLLDATLLNLGTNGMKVHLGFYVATMSLYRSVIESVGYQLGKHPTYKVVITGHSLGGAMARMTTFFITFNSQFPGVPIELYTYGEPRVGNRPFAEYFNNLSITSARCVNEKDIVPHMAPTSILGTSLLYDFYVHPQLEIWIQNGGITYCGNAHLEDPACSNSADPSYTLPDHSSYFGVVGTCGDVVTPAPPPSNPPSLPTKITNFAAGAINFLVGLLL